MWIGSGYTRYRQPDPRIAEDIWRALAHAHTVLHVAPKAAMIQSTVSVGHGSVSVLHHPAFQSLVLPVVLAAAGMMLLRALPGQAGRRWAPLGAALGLLVALAVLPGFGWPAPARVQKLPWVVLAGVAVAAFSMAYPDAAERAGRHGTWPGAALCWAAASVWLADSGAGWLQWSAWALAGAVVLALLAGGQPGSARQHAVALGSAPKRSASSGDGVHPAAALTVAALGLAALAASGGSLLLAQLATMLAAVTAVLGLWTWLRPRSGLSIPPAALMPLGLAWLCIAMALPSSGLQGWVRLALLALAFAAPLLLARCAGFARRTRWAPAVVVALAAVPVALTLAWKIAADDGVAETPGSVEDDAYYTPQWR